MVVRNSGWYTSDHYNWYTTVIQNIRVLMSEIILEDIIYGMT